MNYTLLNQPKNMREAHKCSIALNYDRFKHFSWMKNASYCLKKLLLMKNVTRMKNTANYHHEPVMSSSAVGADVYFVCSKTWSEQIRTEKTWHRICLMTSFGKSLMIVLVEFSDGSQVAKLYFVSRLKRIELAFASSYLKASILSWWRPPLLALLRKETVIHLVLDFTQCLV